MRWLWAVYRSASRLLPADFRARAGPSLEQAARVCLERERRRGRLAAAGAWAHLFADLLVTATRLRFFPADRHYRRQQQLAAPPPRHFVEAVMDNLFKDIKYALRVLRRQPGFTLVTILTLALGIGANTAVFSVVNGVLLRPLPYPQPERLQFVTSQFIGLGFEQFWISLPEFADFRDHNQAFSSVGAYNVGAFNLGTSPPSRPTTALVTPELLPTLGVPPLRGRWFTPADSVPNAPDVGILSFELWQRAFGADPDIVGRSIQVNNTPTQVVGVMPRGFDVHDQRVELWLPLTIDPSTFPNTSGNHFLYLIGRLRDGVNIGQARADLDRLLANWPTLLPKFHVPNREGHPFRIDPLRDDIVGSVQRALVVLQAAVVVVLLIACANLASLLIARADSRRREHAVRAALGASRGRLFAQLFTEGLILAVTAAALGVGLAVAGVSALLAVNPTAIPRAAEISLDWRVLGFTLAVATLTGLIFALVPLLHLRADQMSQAVKEANIRTTAGAARVWVRSTLVVAEVALAVTLVVGAGLLVRSFLNLMRVDMGFDRSHLTTFGIVLPGATYNAQQRVSFYTRLTDSLRALPGVQTVSAMSGLPPLRQVNANDTDFEHIPNNRPPGELPAENVDYYQFVTVGYPETMGIPVMQGRTFEQKDIGGPPVVMVNETLVRKFFADRDPIGARVKRSGSQPVPWSTIIGVLKDVKQGGVSTAAGTEVYFLTDQMPGTQGFAPGNMNFVVRSTRSLEQLAPEFRGTVAKMDPGLPLIRMRSMDDVVSDAVARPRFLTILLGLFGGLALILAAIGTYGILSYLVAERRQEIGIRMALGADRRLILRLILGRGLLLSAIGLALGLVASLALTRLIATLLFNVTPTDPVTLAIVSTGMAAVAVAACLIPAWRATTVDPLVVLREN